MISMLKIINQYINRKKKYSTTAIRLNASALYIVLLFIYAPLAVLLSFNWFIVLTLIISTVLIILRIRKIK